MNILAALPFEESPAMILTILSLGLMFSGFIFRKRLFNLFSVPAFIALALYFTDNIPMVVMFVCMILYNIYYALIADVVEWLYCMYI